jgi:AmiR/NasT family two-component response regulator
MTLLLVRSTGLSDQDLAARINEAIAGRAVIERAKGVLAYRLGLDMGDSYRRLLEHALANDLSVSAAAEQVVRDAHL